MSGCSRIRTLSAWSCPVVNRAFLPLFSGRGVYSPVARYIAINLFTVLVHTFFSLAIFATVSPFFRASTILFRKSFDNGAGILSPPLTIYIIIVYMFCQDALSPRRARPDKPGQSQTAPPGVL